jgi:NAD(P)-dependent dehydrogenase (short-subunit alcohol dehydrogenase family)
MLEQDLRFSDRAFGSLDALVNNAGLADPVTGAVEELTLAAWCARWSTKSRSVGVPGC